MEDIGDRVDLGAMEPDSGPVTPKEVKAEKEHGDGTNLTRPAKTHGKMPMTNESLDLLGAGQGYPNRE